MLLRLFFMIVASLALAGTDLRQRIVRDFIALRPLLGQHQPAAASREAEAESDRGRDREQVAFGAERHMFDFPEGSRL